MKYVFGIIFLLMFVYSHSQSQTINKEITSKDLVKNAINIQNRSFLNDENGGSIDTSIHYATTALTSWISLKDTINEANIRKYLGYLYGKKGLYYNGKAEIFNAIELFNTKKYEPGVAVSYFDLSKVYGYEKKYDSALYYVNLAIEYWEQKADTFRILTNMNQKLYLSIKIKNFKLARFVLYESEKLLVKKKLHWRPVVDFYYLSIELNKKLMNKRGKKYYEDLYDFKIKELESLGIIIVKEYN